MKKRIVAYVCFLVMLTGLLTGCKASPEKFSAEGMTITLTDAFKQETMEGTAAYFESSKALVVAIKETFIQFEELGMSTDITLEEYIDLVVENNTEMQVNALDVEGLTAFIYESVANKKDFTFFASVYESDDAFWLVQFACKTKDYEEMQEDFVKWAKSVKFE